MRYHKSDNLKFNDRAAGVRFVFHEYDYRSNRTSTINHKNYNFREKKNKFFCLYKITFVVKLVHVLGLPRHD